MTAHERILALHLLEKQKKCPEYAEKIGIHIKMIERPAKKAN